MPYVASATTPESDDAVYLFGDTLAQCYKLAIADRLTIVHSAEISSVDRAALESLADRAAAKAAKQAAKGVKVGPKGKQTS